MGALATFFILLQPTSPALAEEGPPLGRYDIVNLTLLGGELLRPGSTTGYMIPREGGVYEDYDMTNNDVRSRGTYTLHPGEGRDGALWLWWRSGLNLEMGGGGSYFPNNERNRCKRCILLDTRVIAIHRP